MTAHEFTPWPKTARLFRDIVITEKIDGTNAAVHITPLLAGTLAESDSFPQASRSIVVDGTRYVLTAQSRKRIITPDSDNYGFSRWVYENAEALVRTLGTGLHFGEWWGRGIQRGYDMGGKHFALFNTDKHRDVFTTVGGSMVYPVPVLYRGPFSEHEIRSALVRLRERGSAASPGFMDPEGVCVYHTQTRSVFKVTLDNNDAGKWESPSR